MVGGGKHVRKCVCVSIHFFTEQIKKHCKMFRRIRPMNRPEGVRLVRKTYGLCSTKQKNWQADSSQTLRQMYSSYTGPQKPLFKQQDLRNCVWKKMSLG